MDLDLATHSCEAQLITLIEEIYHALDCHHQVDLIMLDFSKAVPTPAFYTHYGIHGKLHN